MGGKEVGEGVKRLQNFLNIDFLKAFLFLASHFCSGVSFYPLLWYQDVVGELLNILLCVPHLWICGSDPYSL